MVAVPSCVSARVPSTRPCSCADDWSVGQGETGAMHFSGRWCTFIELAHEQFPDARSYHYADSGNHFKPNDTHSSTFSIATTILVCPARPIGRPPFHRASTMLTSIGSVNPSRRAKQLAQPQRHILSDSDSDAGQDSDQDSDFHPGVDLGRSQSFSHTSGTPHGADRTVNTPILPRKGPAASAQAEPAVASASVSIAQLAVGALTDV